MNHLVQVEGGISADVVHGAPLRSMPVLINAAAHRGSIPRVRMIRFPYLFFLTQIGIVSPQDVIIRRNVRAG